MLKLDDLGEKTLLKRLSSHIREGSRLVRAFSEDCAILEGAGDSYQLLTVDTQIEGKHFRREWTTPFLIGRKALNVSLSDIAAMGGRAIVYLVSLGLPAGTPVEFVEEMYRGMDSASAETGAILAGGNVAESPVLFLDITVLGEVKRNVVLLRTGASPGDLLFVTGPLGSAALGLRLLQQGVRMKGELSQEDRAAILAQCDPPCMLEIGARLSSTGMVTAAMDISDGLASDLPEICRESGVGAVIDLDRIPRSQNVTAELALQGGEDYHLLFTVRGSDHASFLSLNLPVHEVGRITDKDQGIKVLNPDGTLVPIAKGFEHFL